MLVRLRWSWRPCRRPPGWARCATGLAAAPRPAYSSVLIRAETSWSITEPTRCSTREDEATPLSYGYTLLCHEAIGALEAAGLDPMVGFLHRHRWGHPALALDLMEEFRPTTVDVAVWRCISARQVRPEQFTVEDPAQGCRMGSDAEYTFLAAYGKRLLTLTTHASSGRRVSFRVALSLQAKALARALLDPDEPYQPHRWK